MKRLAEQQATCTRGPSFPNQSPDATARHYGNQHHRIRSRFKILTKPNVLTTNVQAPKKRRITNPPRTVLISAIPLCFAYGENSLTRRLAHAANTICRALAPSHRMSRCRLTENTTKNIYSTIHPPAFECTTSALLQGCQSVHCEYSVYPQQQKPLLR